MFEVQKLQLNCPVEGMALPESFGMYKSTGEWLGTVGKSYTFTQPSEILKMFEDACKNVGFDCSRIQVREMRDGRKVAFEIPLEDFEVKIGTGQRKVGDAVRKSVSFTTSYDGSTSNFFEYYVERLACTNGMTTKDHMASHKFKHTVSQDEKIKLLSKAIQVAIAHQNDIEAKFQLLADVEFNPTVANMQGFIKKLIGYNADDVLKMDEGRSKSTKENKVNALQNSIEREINEIGNNLWGLYNGITWYTNHEVVRDDQEHYIRFAQGKTYNDKALQMVEAMAGV